MSASWFHDHESVETVFIDDRGLQYGDGLFETVAIRDGAPRLLDFHHDRLSRGGDLLGLNIPSLSNLAQQIESALQATEAALDDATAKILVTAGSGERGYARGNVAEPKVFIGVFPNRRLSHSAYSDGVTARLCETRLASGSVFAGLKTLNRLEQVAARSELSESDDFEGLTMDADGHIICGTMSNVFFVVDNKIQTPALDQCGVEGVMRRHIIEVCEDNDLKVEVTRAHESILSVANEVFVSNSQIGIVPIRRCASFAGRPGELTQRLMSLLAAGGISECRL